MNSKLMKKFPVRKFKSLRNRIEFVFDGIYTVCYTTYRTYLIVYSQDDMFSSAFCDELSKWCLLHDCTFLFTHCEYGGIECHVLLH